MTRDADDQRLSSGGVGLVDAARVIGTGEAAGIAEAAQESGGKLGRTRSTWRDLLEPGTPEPDVLLTRTELLERLHELGGDVSSSTLAYWESQGITPRGIRRWVNGSSQTQYPEWMVPMLLTVRTLQREGTTLHDIRDILSSIDWLHSIEPIEGTPRTREEHQALTGEFNMTLLRDLQKLAWLQERLTGVPVLLAEFQMIDAQGKRFGIGRVSRHRRRSTD